MTAPDLEPVAAVAALAGLPGMGPARLRALLAAWPGPEAWDRVRRGALRHELLARVRPETQLMWQQSAARIDPAELADRHADAGITVTMLGDPTYPEALEHDVEPPSVLFHVGDLAALDAPRVAIVGTRRCTAAGAVTARELGRDLAEAGVVVVSGLALGIDGAAHRGVLGAGTAPPVGVVANGLDSPYPAEHRALWADVGRCGLLLGEAPLGVAPAAWRFPARNRIIAALADLVVVVESHVKGGSMHTVDEALARDVDVLAVPGSVRSPAAVGTNRLLQDGCGPVLGADDVLVALGLTAGVRRPRDRRPAPTGDAAAVLDALGGEPATLDHLAIRTSLPLERVSLALAGLLDSGWISDAAGWFERIGPASL